MIVIPIGIDCRIAQLLRRHDIRKNAYPFDWIVSYHGVYEFIKNDFQDFFPTTNHRNHKYEFKFFHDQFPKDCEKYHRRISRLKQALEQTDEPVILIRNGHAPFHHQDRAYIGNDLEDAYRLCEHLVNKYPKLEFKIIVLLVCGYCFPQDSVFYKSRRHDDNIIIYHMTTRMHDHPLSVEYINKMEPLYHDVFEQLLTHHLV